MDENQRLLLAVAYDEVSNTYKVDVGKGSNVAETAFAMSVVIRCFVRDGIVKEPQEVIDYINKYLNDVQYNEVTQDEHSAS